MSKLRNALVNFIAPTHHAINHVLIKLWYDRSDNPEKIRALKGIHAKDKRCFLVGNGPSLTPEDLDLIKDEITFASNKIYHVFDKTEFRPTYYITGDARTISKNPEDIKKVSAKKILVGLEHFLSYKNPFKDSSVILFRVKTIMKKGTLYPIVKTRVDDYVHAGHTVLFAICEFAMYMGFTEIYLLGVDFNYTGTQAHFYRKDQNDGTYQTNPDEQIYAYEALKEFAEQNNIKIYNATRGGKLEVFPRIKLEDALS